MTTSAQLKVISFSAAAITAGTLLGVDLAGNLTVAQNKAYDLYVALGNLKVLLGSNDVNISVINTTMDTLIQTFSWANLADPSYTVLLPALLSN